MNLNSVNPYIRVAIHSVLPPNVMIHRRVIYDYELIYIADGEFILYYGDIEYLCKKGAFVLLCPGVPHVFKGIGVPISQPHIHFDISYRADSEIIPVSYKDIPDMNSRERGWISENVFDGQQSGPFVHFNDKERFFRLFYKILASPEKEERLYKKGLMIEIIDMLIKDNFPDSFKNQIESKFDVIIEIKDYLDRGFGLDMGLEDFERQFSYSRFYIEKRFKRLYKTGLISYRNRKRMELARELLKTETVSAVSERVGYGSIYSFSRAYKAYYGKSPTK